MSMVDNYSETLRALCQFLVANAPAGAERDVKRIIDQLEAGQVPTYVHLEWRRERSSCQLYVDIGKFGGQRSVDEEGNTWHTYEVEANVSWPSWGSDNVKVCQERLALMTEVVRLAAEVERVFSGKIHHLTQTKAERDEVTRRLAETAARQRIERLMRANCKGLRVGQERRVEADDSDFLPVGRVTYTTTAPDGTERRYTTEVTATRTFYFMRVA